MAVKKKKKSQLLKNFTFKLIPAQIRTIKKLSRERKQTQSDFIRAAIDAYSCALQHKEPIEAPSDVTSPAINAVN